MARFLQRYLALYKTGKGASPPLHGRREGAILGASSVDLVRAGGMCKRRRSESGTLMPRALLLILLGAVIELSTMLAAPMPPTPAWRPHQVSAQVVEADPGGTGPYSVGV